MSRMERGAIPSSDLFPRVVLQGYVFGTIVAAIVLHVAVAIIAPGDAGTLLALGSGAFFVLILFMLGLFGLVAFPLAALVSWPLREWVIERPSIALISSTLTGFLVGVIATATGFKVGPDDFWSGSLVGSTYGLIWFLVVRRAALREPAADA